jgi:hypothetical protein
MPIHDWTRVDAGIFHHFHHEWISQLARVLNHGGLPADYYALAEQFAGSTGPDVLTLQQLSRPELSPPDARTASSGQGLQAAQVALRPTAESDMAYYRRKQKVIVIRHVSGDGVVAVIEVVSRGNKAARNALRAFVEKAGNLLENGIHLLILDLFPPGRRDRDGIHGAIWQEIAGEKYDAPPGQPFTLAAYDASSGLRAYVVHTAVGATLPDMPLFLEPERAVPVPLEATYNAAYADVPRRWQCILEPSNA